MAVNIKYLMEKGLSFHDFTNMILLAQNTEQGIHEELILNMTEDDLTRLHALGLVSLVKKKRKSDHDFTTMRLSKKGKEVYRNAQITDYTEADEKLMEALGGLYNKIDKSIGNDVKVKQLLAWFRTETQYSRKMIYLAIKFFILKHEDKEKVKYVPTLENLIWRGDNIFAAKWNLSSSKLYQFIQENKKELNGYTAN